MESALDKVVKVKLPLFADITPEVFPLIRTLTPDKTSLVLPL
jgi:hypothetical protein